MITYLQLANVLQFSVVAGFWVFVFCKMIPEWRLDSFRQNVFIVRDELFDYAADGYISFDHPAYILLRRQMNGLIRYGHHLTVFRGLMTIAIHKISGAPTRTSWYDAWQKSLGTIEDDSVRQQLERFHRRGMVLAISRLISGSPLLLAMTAIFLVEFLFQGMRQSLMQLIKSAAKKAFITGPINDRLIEEAAQGEFA
jgi:hypothetical protein